MENAPVLDARLVFRGVGIIDIEGWIEKRHVGELTVHELFDVGQHGGVTAQETKWQPLGNRAVGFPTSGFHASSRPNVHKRR